MNHIYFLASGDLIINKRINDEFLQFYDGKIRISLLGYRPHFITSRVS